jgi:hypothetical protein
MNLGRTDERALAPTVRVLHSVIRCQGNVLTEHFVRNGPLQLVLEMYVSGPLASN